MTTLSEVISQFMHKNWNCWKFIWNFLKFDKFHCISRDLSNFPAKSQISIVLPNEVSNYNVTLQSTFLSSPPHRNAFFSMNVLFFFFCMNRNAWPCFSLPIERYIICGRCLKFLRSQNSFSPALVLGVIRKFVELEFGKPKSNKQYQHKIQTLH